MTIVSRIAIQEIIESDCPSNELQEKVAELFQRVFSEGNEYSGELLSNFWQWLVDCPRDKQQTEDERGQQIRDKLSLLLKRCDTDASLIAYLLKSIKNYESENQGWFEHFYRAFYKKAREVLSKDIRFKALRQGEHLFFGLQKWKADCQITCEELSGELMEIAKLLGEKGHFPRIKSVTPDSFIPSKDLADASYRTMDYERFFFFCSLRALFDLLHLTGQLDAFVPPEIVDIEQDNGDGEKHLGLDGIASSTPSPSGLSQEGTDRAGLYWGTLDAQAKRLLAFYIIPKESGEKISRGELVGKLGFNNEVTMKNHEEEIKRNLKVFLQEHEITLSEQYISFVRELECLAEDLKFKQP